MSFPPINPGIFLPEDIDIVASVYNRIISEPWVKKDPDSQDSLARYVLGTYSAGVRDPEKLFRSCLVAAGKNMARGSRERNSFDALE